MSKPNPRGKIRQNEIAYYKQMMLDTRLSMVELDSELQDVILLKKSLIDCVGDFTLNTYREYEQMEELREKTKRIIESRDRKYELIEYLEKQIADLERVFKKPTR
jgi:hypothetical protein